MDNVTVDMFQEGDIVLFRADFSKPKEDWISIVIAILTNSDVSHAALFMGNGLISDEASNGLGYRRLSQENETLPIYVLRKKQPIDKSPVLAVAHSYLEEGEPYDYAALVLLGLIIIYEHLPNHKLSEKFTIPIIKAAALALDKYIQSNRHPGKQPMICSQYVYECYQKAGSEYELDCSKQVLKSSQGKDNLIKAVYEQVKNKHQVISYEMEENVLDLNLVKNIDFGESFINELLSEKGPKEMQVGNFSIEYSDDLIKAIFNFSQKLIKLLKNGESKQDVLHILEFCSKIEKNSLFVTPADLKNCTYLNMIGQDTVSRIDLSKEA